MVYNQQKLYMKFNKLNVQMVELIILFKVQIKNFLVPVGGSIVLTYDSQLFDKLSHAYPGRASITPTMDIFITLLSMGKN